MQQQYHSQGFKQKKQIQRKTQAQKRKIYEIQRLKRQEEQRIAEQNRLKRLEAQRIAEQQRMKSFYPTSNCAI